MKKLLSLMLAAVMLLSFVPGITVYADYIYSGTCGANLKWTLDSDGTLTISGTGDMADWDDHSNRAPWDNNGLFIKKVIIGDGVTSIGDWAFRWCENLTSVTIGSSVKNIGNYAFFCCQSLTSITIPDSVTSIGDDVFDGCGSLTYITIGRSVANIGSRVLANFTNIEVSENNPNYRGIGGVLFDKSATMLIQYPTSNNRTAYTIPDNVTTIGDWAFAGCESLTNINIPKSVTSIGDFALAGSANIEVSESNPNYRSIDGVLFNKSATMLIQYPIDNNRTAYTIPDSVTTIGDYSFVSSYNLTSINIPNSVTSIGDYSFYWCRNLTSINIPDSVTSIGYGAFADCGNLTSITIGNSVASIGDYAFSGCENLTSIIIGNSVTSIGDLAFYGCERLTSVTIPDSVTIIGACAFRDCESLASITIGKSVTSIGDLAFYYCTSLVNVYYGGTETQWNSIEIGDLNDPLINATIHYNYDGYTANNSTNASTIKVILDGKELRFDQPPVIVNGRTLVPVRAIFEAMGAIVDWDGNTQTVTSSKRETAVIMTIGSNILYKNGVSIYLDVPAQLIGGYTMVPVRAVAEAFGAEVTWDGDAQTVYIITKELGDFD